MINKVFNFFEQKKTMRYVIFIMYFIINALFLIKYGMRQDKISVFILMILFGIFHILIFNDTDD